jgi:hypothetical protein
LKQAEYQFTLTFAGGPQDRAQIDQVHSALVDLRTIVNDGRNDDAIRPALRSVAAKTNDSRGAVAALPAGAEREAVELIIDGRPDGVVSQSTSEQLVAVVSNSGWSPGAHALGVRNPDGTAAQMALSGEGDDHKRYATPQPSDDSGE